MKSGNFNFLEPSGPLQACNGTALPFLFTFHYQHSIIIIIIIITTTTTTTNKTVIYINH